MNLVFFGPPGSGKGTQAQYLVQTQKFLHISTGELLRGEVKRGTLLGNAVKNVLDTGGFPSDDIIIQLVESAIDQSEDKYIIFDGVPRTIIQAVELDKLLEKFNSKIDLVIDFCIDLSLLADRISGRYTCENCSAVYNDTYQRPKVEGICDHCGAHRFVKRQDDNPDVLKKRIHKYLSETEAVKDYYMNKKLLVEINASNNPERVRDDLWSYMAQAGFDF